MRLKRQLFRPGRRIERIWRLSTHPFFTRARAEATNSASARHSAAARKPLLATIAENTGALFSIAVSVILLVLIAAFVVGFAQEMRRSRVVVEPISVPRDIAERGYDAVVASQLVVDEIQTIQKAANTAHARRALVSDSDIPDVQIIGAGTSMQAIVRYVRSMFGNREARITGQLLRDPAGLRMVLNLSDAQGRQTVQVAHADEDVDALLKAGGRAIVQVTDPYVLAAYLFALADHDKDYAATLAAIDNLLLHGRGNDAPWALNLLGLVETNRGNYEQAIDAFRRAVGYANAPDAAYGNYANALQSVGRLPEARALLLARANAPGVTADNLAALCYGLFWTNYDDDGIKLCQRSIDLRDNVGARNAAALMLWNKGHLEEAWQQVEKARDLAAPDDYSWAAPATFIRAQRGDAAAALAFVDSVLKQTPAGDDNLRWLHYARSIVLLQLARPADAMAEVTPFLDGKVMTDYPLEWQAGEILMATANPAAARTYFDAALVKAPNFARALAGRARALAAQGDLVGAERDFDRATTLTPDNADLWTDWAVVLDTAGQRQEATIKRAKASEAMARTHSRKP